MMNSSDAARALAQIRTEKRAKGARRNLETAREVLATDPDAAERKRKAVSEAQKLRWEKYRLEKAALQASALPTEKKKPGRPPKKEKQTDGDA